MPAENQTPKTDTPASSENTTSHVDTRETSRPDPASSTPPALAKDTTSHINPASKSEPITQVQADSVLTREQLPNAGFRITLSIVTLAILVFVAALYFGIINP
jgi:hypothetical protein